jgi:hypothetical protein
MLRYDSRSYHMLRRFDSAHMQHRKEPALKASLNRPGPGRALLDYFVDFLGKSFRDPPITDTIIRALVAERLVVLPPRGS